VDVIDRLYSLQYERVVRIGGRGFVRSNIIHVHVATAGDTCSPGRLVTFARLLPCLVACQLKHMQYQSYFYNIKKKNMQHTLKIVETLAT
jgi:hypothetical protein